MLNRFLKIAVLVILGLGIFLNGCGPKPIKKESELDTWTNHYNQGLRELKAGRLDRAVFEFNRAKGLDPDSPGGYIGLGLVEAEKGNFKEAVDLVNKGIDKDNKFIDGYIFKGRILTKQRKGDDWVKDAVKEFDKALKIDPESDKAIFYKGVTYKENYDFGDAANCFSQVISLKGDYAEEANSEWELVQKIQRAAPGTKVGAKIALIPEIDRADLAVLFVEELKLLEVLEKKQERTYDTGFRPPEDPTAMETTTTEEMAKVTDIDDHWAKNWIESVIETGVIDVFPDHTFHPDELITKANYALFLQNILITVTGDQSLATKFIGSDSPNPDVNSTHYAFNAIRLALERGFMALKDKMRGEFGPSDPVSGADALLIIREFQNALRMTF